MPGGVCAAPRQRKQSMDTEPRTTTPNKEVSALSTGEPTYRSEGGSHYQHSSGPSFSQWNRDGSRKQRGHVPQGGNGEQHESTTDKGTAAHVTAVVTSTSKMITRRAKEITKRRLKAKDSETSAAAVAIAKAEPAQPLLRMSRSPRANPTTNAAATTHSSEPSLTTMLTIKCCTCLMSTTKRSQRTRRKTRMRRNSPMARHRRIEMFSH